MSSSEWKRYKLGEIAEIVMGQSPSSETCNEVGEGLPLLNGPTEFTNYSPLPVQFTNDPRKISEIGDLLFCVRGSTTGKMNWSDKKYAIGRGLAAIRHKKGNAFQPFLKALIELNLNNILLHATGSTFPNVSSLQLLNLDVLVPNAGTQQRIATILSSLDDKIELNRQTNQTLEAMAQALFQEMCVPKGEGLPKGWRVGKLGEIIEVKYGKDHKLLGDGFIPVYGSGGIMRFVDKVLYDKESVLIPRKGSLNNVLLINEPFWSVDTMFYTVMKEEYYTKFVYFFVKSLDLASMNVGSAVPSMTTEILNNISVVLPSDIILKSYNNAAVGLFNMMQSNNKETQTLIALRDSLLPKLMKGEINVESL